MNPKNPQRGVEGDYAQDDADLREALDLWREDTARTADRIDVGGDLADRVVAIAEAAAERGRPLALALAPTGARLYAAAAVLLIAIGITGTLMARNAGTAANALQAVRFVDIEEAYCDALADDPEYSPGLEGR